MLKSTLFLFYFKRTIRDNFTVGYSIMFPFIMIFLLGYLLKNSYGNVVSSFQYYTITLLPFCILCEIITAAYLGQEEARKKVAERFLISPVSANMIIGIKILAGTLALSICHGIVMVLTSLLWNFNYGGKGIYIFIMFTGLTFVSISVGLFLGIGTKHFLMIKNILNIPVFIFGVMAGCFYPVGSLNPLIDGILKLSPLTWINRGVFLSIFDKNHTVLILTIICLFLIGFILTIIAMIQFKKEEFLHGDTFSYQK